MVKAVGRDEMRDPAERLHLGDELGRGCDRLRRQPGSPSGLSEVVTLARPEGKHVVGGGVSIADTDKGSQRDIRIAMSRPTAGGTSWEAQLFNASVSFGLNAT